MSGAIDLMLLVWHTIGQKSRGSGQFSEWLVVRVFYGITDFAMLNSVDLSGFVTLSFWHFITPQQRAKRFGVERECDIFKFSLGSHS